jgi:serine/threonine protein kinase
MELYGLRRVSSSETESKEVDPYTLEKAIHAGKSNIRILKATDPASKETVAIKLFPKSKSRKSMPNFFNEERSASKLSHPHILKYHAFYEDALIQLGKDEFKEYSAIVMEYIPYGDLFGLVSQRPFSEKLARTIFKQVLSAIKYLHSQNLAHLDIKLENILVDVAEGVKVIDFDACESTKDSAQPVSLNKGSPGYRAPEFVKGNAENLLAADIYSLGIVLFILVVGTPPYNEVEKNGKFVFDKHYEVLRTDVKKFWRVHESYRENDGRPKLSKSFKEVIEAMLKEDPTKRPTVVDLERMSWLQGEIYDEDEFEAKLKAFYQK